MAVMLKYIQYFLERVLILVSLGLNSLFLWGYPLQTLSARCYVEGRKTAMKAIDSLFFWEDEHCRKAWEWEVRNARMMVELDKKRKLSILSENIDSSTPKEST